MQRIIPFTILVLSIAGCDTGVDGDTTASGAATFEDAETDAMGAQQEPARPAQNSMSVEIRVEGSGDLEGLDPQCLDGLGGSFEGLYMGEGSVDDDGVYVAALASSEATFETPGGCDIPDVQVTTVTSVVVRAELTTTTTNCESYCSAKARNYAEAECQGEADQVSCRSAAEAQYSASCTTQCNTSTHRIVAETELSASAVAALSAQNLTGAALGELSVDLTFDRIEDSDENVVNEAP